MGEIWRKPLPWNHTECLVPWAVSENSWEVSLLQMKYVSSKAHVLEGWQAACVLWGGSELSELFKGWALWKEVRSMRACTYDLSVSSFIASQLPWGERFPPHTHPSNDVLLPDPRLQNSGQGAVNWTLWNCQQHKLFLPKRQFLRSFVIVIGSWLTQSSSKEAHWGLTAKCLSGSWSCEYLLCRKYQHFHLSASILHKPYHFIDVLGTDLIRELWEFSWNLSPDTNQESVLQEGCVKGSSVSPVLLNCLVH